MKVAKIAASLLVVVTCISMAVSYGHNIGEEIREALGDLAFGSGSLGNPEPHEAPAYLASKLANFILELVIILLAVFGIIKILLEVFFFKGVNLWRCAISAIKHFWEAGEKNNTSRSRYNQRTIP